LSNKCVRVFGAYALLCFRCALLRCPTRQHCRSFLAWIKLSFRIKENASWFVSFFFFFFQEV
jgi:hypothetical protein